VGNTFDPDGEYDDPWTIIIHAPRTSPVINNYYERITNKYGKKKAKATMNHKFGVAIYYMLKNKQGFDEKRFIQTDMK
jgi:hypothetical protein